MVTAKSGNQKAQPKSKFTTRSLESLIRKINKNPDLLREDWRKVVSSHFRLSDEEEKSLADTTPRKVKKIQQFLLEVAEQIRKGEPVTGKLVKRPVKERTKELVYDVDVDFAQKKVVRRRKNNSA